MNWLAAVRGSYGLVVVAFPARVVRSYSARPPRPRAITVARVLGARHVVQAVASVGSPSADARLLGVEADLLHALSAVGLTLLDRRWRRGGVIEALLALLFAAAGVAAARGGPAAEARGGLADLRNNLAAALAARLVPPPLRRWAHA